MSALDPRRTFDITASDVPAICRECCFQTPRSVLFKKALRLRGADTPATLHGKHYEPIAIQKFCEATGAKVEFAGAESVYRKHEVYTWLGGTVDGVATFPDGRKMILEVKCPISRPIKADCIPPHYVGQVQTYMFIYDFDACVFVQYKPAGIRRPERLEITYIDRDPKYMSIRLPRLKVFWNELVLWIAYTERVVTVIQRSWRFYLARKALGGAAKNSMVARLRCAKMVGKMTGFCKTRDAQQATAAPPSPLRETVYFESNGIRSPNMRGALLIAEDEDAQFRPARTQSPVGKRRTFMIEDAQPPGDDEQPPPPQKMPRISFISEDSSPPAKAGAHRSMPSPRLRGIRCMVVESGPPSFQNRRPTKYMIEDVS